MKRFWHTWLAFVATAMMAGAANAQEIGSYQSILARAGYSQGAHQGGAVSFANPPQMSVPSPPGAACSSGCGTQGGMHGGGAMYGGGMVGGGAGYGGGNFVGNGGITHGGTTYSGGGNFAGGAYGGSAYGGMYNGGSAYGGSQMNGGMVGGQMNAMASGGMVGGTANGGMVGGQMSGGMVGGAANGGMVGGGTFNGGMAGGQMSGGMVGGVANGGMVSGAVNGGVVSGGMVGNGVVNGGAVHSGQIVNGGMMTGGAVYGQNVGGYVGGPVVAAPAYGTSYVDYGVANCNAAPVYVAGNAGVKRRLSGLGSGNNNNVLGLFGVVLRRDYEDAVLLATDGGGNRIQSTGIEHGRMSGLGVSFASRNSCGFGYEMIYWGLDEEDDRTYFGPLTSNLNGLTAATLGGFDVYTLFNGASDIRVYRDTDIHNFEINMLRNGGQYTTRHGRSANYELTGGLRFFKFDESFRYVSNSDLGTYPTYPSTIEYSLEAENTLVGFQVGGRSEICLSNRIRMNYGGQFGLFNNNVNTRQRIFDETGAIAQVSGRDLDYMDTKNDAAMLGQFDLGLIYHVSNSARVRLGYRALGISGVALAADQIPYDFTDGTRMSTAQTNGSLLLHGLYFGSEFCF